MKSFQFRSHVKTSDPESIRRIVQSSGFFYPEEVEVAVELALENLSKGEEVSGYYFVFAEKENEAPAGYACFGPIACTFGSFDLFWIAVEESYRGKGLGKLLLEQAEEHIRRMGGRLICIETSSRELYRPTQNFYRACGYALESEIKDFYQKNDHKLTFIKRL